MSLTFLCAGCSSDERDEAEASVKVALGERTRNETWVVSLVKAAASWSVTMDGPECHALSFIAPEQSLGDAIRERLAGPPPAAPQAKPAVAPRAAPMAQPGVTHMRDRHECRSCRHAFAVIYELEGDEDQEMVSIACPHCWQTNHVLIAEAAAYTEAFRAEKLET